MARSSGSTRQCRRAWQEALPRVKGQVVAVDTKTAPRRTLSFRTVDDALAEVGRIKEFYDAGTLRTTGNWSPGQNLGHIAGWIDFGYVGYPPGRPPFFVRWILRVFRKKFLYAPSKPGFNLPGIDGGTFARDEMDFPTGHAKLVAALARMKAGAPTHVSPAFGLLTHEQYEQMHLRHAELHLGFLTGEKAREVSDDAAERST